MWPQHFQSYLHKSTDSSEKRKMNVKIAQMQGGNQILYMVIRYILAFPIGKKNNQKGQNFQKSRESSRAFCWLGLEGRPTTKLIIRDD